MKRFPAAALLVLMAFAVGGDAFACPDGCAGEGAGSEAAAASAICLRGILVPAPARFSLPEHAAPARADEPTLILPARVAAPIEHPPRVA